MHEQALIRCEARVVFVTYYLYAMRNNTQHAHTQGAHAQCMSHKATTAVRVGQTLHYLLSRPPHVKDCKPYKLVCRGLPNSFNLIGVQADSFIFLEGPIK